MKRKGFVVLAVAAVLALGTATMSAWAAEGWAQSGNTWVYYDSNGYKDQCVEKRRGQLMEIFERQWRDGREYMGR